MVKKTTTLLLSMLMCMMFTVGLSSCDKDKEKENEPATSSTPSSPIVGTWTCDNSSNSYYDFDEYTLVFNDDATGYIKNSYGSRASTQMNFNWSLNMASNGTYLLSVIYKSGDRDVDGPFSGGYAQYNSTVTIAGNTLSISTGGDYVMLFQRQ